MTNEVTIVDLGRSLKTADEQRMGAVGELVEAMNHVRAGAFDTMSDSEIKSTVDAVSQNGTAIINGVKMSDRYITGKAAKALLAKEGNGIDSGRLAAEYLDAPRMTISRAINLAERVDGIDAVLSITSIAPEEKRVLTQFRDRMTAKPDISTVYALEMKNYRKSIIADNDDGVELPEYTTLDEAYVLDDVITYYAPIELGKANFKKYIEKTIEISEVRMNKGDYDSNPWTISRDDVEEYDLTRSKILLPKTKAPTKAKAKVEVVEEYDEEEMDCSMNFNAFSEWYTDIKCEMPMTMTESFESIAGDSIDTIAAIPEAEWNTFRRKMVSELHPDKHDGKDVGFTTATLITDLVSALRESKQLLRNLHNRNKKNEEIRNMDWNQREPLYAEFKIYKSEKGEK